MITLQFNPPAQACNQIANACMATNEKIRFLNEFQPAKVTSFEDLAMAMRSSNNILSAAVFEKTSNSPIGFIFCGRFFLYHFNETPHLGFGLNQDFVGRGYAKQMIQLFINELRAKKLSNHLYGHCYAINTGACRTMEGAGMSGKNIGVQPLYSHGNEVMEYFIKL